jgi:hypothetical protein
LNFNFLEKKNNFISTEASVEENSSIAPSAAHYHPLLSLNIFKTSARRELAPVWYLGANRANPRLGVVVKQLDSVESTK